MAGSATHETQEALQDLIEASQALGDPSLTLHGGGNTSVKGTWRDVTGAEVPALFVKGSGHALATIQADGFAPLRLARLRELLPPTELGDLELADELRCALLDSRAPNPSVETLVHAALPHTFVLHSHADAILSVTNSPEGRALVERLYGDRVIVVDYVMPGPDLGAACDVAWQALDDDERDRVEGIVLLNHGLFSMADTAEEALRRHLDLVAIAEEHLDSVRVERELPAEREFGSDEALHVTQLRARLSEAAGDPLVVRRDGGAETAALIADAAVVEATQAGPMTPDHVIWNKSKPLVGDDVDAFVSDYDRYFEVNNGRHGGDLARSDAAPRVILHPELGLLSAGRTGKEARIAQDIAQHTLAGVADAVALGGYEPAGPEHVFDIEYWAPEQEKRRMGGGYRPMAGRVAVVTGAASGIGRACAAELLEQGASVIGWDLSPEVATTFDGPEWLGLQVDVSDAEAQRQAIIAGVEAFGGLDILVVAAGIFPAAQHLTELDMEMWRRAMSINVDSVAALFGIAQPFLKEAPGGGRVCVVASKNVAAPGPGAAAYSASKAAITQLSRIAALEWAGDGIRVNMVHPDAVFDTKLWKPELLAQRAEHYGMTIDEYKRRNLLKAEVRSVDVAAMVRAMADDTFRCTTAAQVPVDGGNERVI